MLLVTKHAQNDPLLLKEYCSRYYHAGGGGFRWTYTRINEGDSVEDWDREARLTKLIEFWDNVCLCQV